MKTIILLSFLGSVAYATGPLFTMPDEQTLHVRLRNIGKEYFNKKISLSKNVANKTLTIDEISVIIDEHIIAFEDLHACDKTNIVKTNAIATINIVKLHKPFILRALLADYPNAI
ncbi:hypothetical protein KBD08_01245 [Candidatus Babeliales bacterium]|nr:hypothetical protein [Candidatus Babeliales bacterium]